MQAQDYFYVCIGHLSDRGFCQPDADEAAEIAARKKKEEMDREIEKVKKEYEEKQRIKKERRKAKDKDKDKETKSNEEEEDKKDEKAKDDKVCVHHVCTLNLANNIVDHRAHQVKRRSCDRAYRSNLPSQQVRGSPPQRHGRI